MIDETQYRNVRDLEQVLKKTLRKASPFSAEARQHCQTLREAYEEVIFSNHQLAQTVDTHQALWKNVFYRCIQEYRSRIRKYSEATRHATNERGKAEELLRQTTAAFGGFLSEATGFYHQLIRRLWQVFGETQLSNYKLSCHRCLIYLGDLARYSAQYAEGKSG